MVLLLGWFGFVNFILPSVQDHVPFKCAKLMLPYQNDRFCLTDIHKFEEKLSALLVRHSSFTI